MILCWNTPLNPFSGLIEVLTRHDGVMGASHVCLCRQAERSTATPALATGGPLIWTYTPPIIIEATWGGGANGVRSIPLPQLLGEYGTGTLVKHYALMPEARARAKSGLFYEACGKLDGVAHYDIGALVRFLLPGTLQERITPDPESLRNMVCSQCAAWILEYCHVTYGVDAAKAMPADFLGLADPKRVGGALLAPGVVI